jgi:glutamyl-Q tRNA(Asp) synthetase
LHLGSLVSALACALEAFRGGGHWLLRIEDIDTPRVVPGAADQIIRELARLGFEWSGPVMFQSTRRQAYRAALERLRALGQVYPCACTRKDSLVWPLASDGARRYPGTCRKGLLPGQTARAFRFRVPEGLWAFEDRIQGRIEVDPGAEGGDCVVLRADGVFAYQLAVVVDDAEQGITEVVRGADLLYSTPRQLALQAALGVPAPRYAHVPVVLDVAGDKLSKQTRAAPLSNWPAGQALVFALDFLGQGPPPELAQESVPVIWRYAREHWNPAAIPAQPGRFLRLPRAND